jgi:hypothetical protein
MAKSLLDFHAKFIWVAELDPGQSLSGKRKQDTKIHATNGRKRSKKGNLGSVSAVETCHAESALGEFILDSQLLTGLTSEGSCVANTIGLAPDSFAWQTSETSQSNADPAQQGNHESGNETQGSLASEDASRFNTLVSAACSANPSRERSVEMATMNFVPLPSVQVEETLLDFAALDFVGPHCPESNHGNVLDLTDLDFVAPLLDISDLDYVEPQSSFFPPFYSFEQNVPTPYSR